MDRHHLNIASGFGLAALLAGTAWAQPRLIITSAGEDIDATGNKSLGRMVEWTQNPLGGYPSATYTPYVWERGVGFTRIPARLGETPSFLRGSSDFSALASSLKNVADWGSLNCFNGYCFGAQVGCTPGDPRPPLNPCVIPPIAHRWTAGTGWVNTGSLPRTLDAGTGRYFGGTRCDTINSPNDISGNGRYIVGGAWYAQLTTSTGGPGGGLCGDFYAFKYDAQTGNCSILPSASNSTTTRADYVNNDGSVITGYDLDPTNAFSFRRLCVWTNGVQTLLDTITNVQSRSPVNGPGTAIAGFPGAAFNQATFGSSALTLAKWTRQPNDSWTPSSLGRPADRDAGVTIYFLSSMFPTAISDDGSTIVGTALYGNVARAFIWKPTINGGVPMDLADYVASVDPTNPMIQDEAVLSAANGISADGNAILVSVTDGRNGCTNGGVSFNGLASDGILYLNGASVTCDQPRIAVGPSDWNESHYTVFGVALNVSASGSWPLNYQWQHEDPNAPGTWINLTDDCSNFLLPNGNYTGFSSTFDYEGTRSDQLRIGQDAQGTLHRGGRYRVIVSNSCGSITSAPATVHFETGGCCIAGSCSIDYKLACQAAGGRFVGAGTDCNSGCPCPADLDNGSGTGVFDGGVDVNDLLYLLVQFEAGSAAADLDDGTGTGFHDGGVDINDLLYFLVHFEVGC